MAAVSSTPKCGFNADGLQQILYCKGINGPASLQLLFATAQEADAFFLKCVRSDVLDPFTCQRSGEGSFKWRILIPRAKAAADSKDNSASKTSSISSNKEGAVRFFEAAYTASSANDQNLGKTRLVELLKFLFEPISK